VKIPADIFQGDSVSWHDEPTRIEGASALTISAPGWTLTYYFAGPTVFNVVGTADGDGWDVALSAAQTLAMTAAADPNYSWQAIATNGANRITVGVGQVRVVANLATATAGFDGRSQDEIDLDAVRAAIRARVSGGGVIEYSIGSRRLRNETLSELRAMEQDLMAKVSKARRKQKIANGEGDPRTSYVSFR
jgi:hypothetical protein